MMRTRTIGRPLVSALVLALAAAGVQGAPPATPQVVLDVYDSATGSLRQVRAPAALLPAGAHPGGPQLVSASPRVLRDPVLRARAQAIAAARPAGVDRPAVRAKSRRVPITGTYRAIVLLVDFLDHRPRWYPGTAGQARYQNMLFSVGGYGSGSMRDWYRENSYGQFEVDGLATGGSTGWYRAPARYRYYTDGNNGFNAYPRNAQRLVEDTVRLADPDVDFSRYDNDADGYVESLFVVHSGTGAESSGSYDDIWSHMWSIVADLRCDGVRISDYSIEPEDGAVGVFAHEYGHILGADDLYDYGYDATGVGVWSVMSGGSWGADYADADKPAHFDPYHKIRFGWIRPTVIAADTPGFALPPVQTSPTVLKLWKDGQPGAEYFLVENRQQRGFDAGLPGSGLLVWHVDQRRFNSSVNDTQWYPGQDPAQHLAVALEQADGRWDLEHNFNVGDAGDPFAAGTGAAGFGVGTIPDSASYLAGATGVAVSNLRAAATGISLDVAVTPQRHTWYVRASAGGHGNGTAASPFGTIGQALTAAASGDTITVSPGVYSESVNFAGKEVTLTSSAPDDARVVRNTIIRGIANGPTVVLRHAEQPAAILRGFTVTHVSGITGCGVNISGASPTIDRNVIRDNTDQRSSGGGAWGGGVLVADGANPTLTDNTITGNAADYGAGVCIARACATLTGNRLEGNRASTEGGGLELSACTDTVVIRDCDFLDNEAKWGGGLYSSRSASTITACRFGGNQARNTGGAVALWASRSRLVRPVIYNCRAFLYASSFGGGLHCNSGSSARIDGLSLYGCSAPLGAGLYCEAGSSLTVTNSIVSGCTGPGVQSQVPLSISYSDVWGNSDGDYKGPGTPLDEDGNLSANPQYADPANGDLRLKSRAGRLAAGGAWVKDTVSSPCLDAGAPGEEYVGDEPQPNGGRLNMGADGGTTRASLSVAGSLLAASSPANGDSGVVRRPALKIWFGQLVDQDSAAAHFQLLAPAVGAEAHSLVAGRCRWLTAGKVMQFVPDSALVAGTTYTATITAGVALQAGGTADWAESFSFTTGSQPAVVAYSPSGAAVPSAASIAVTFDHAMDPTAVEAAFSVAPEVAGDFSWPSTSHLVFTPHNPLRLRTQYQVTLLAAAADAAGVALGQQFGWRFTTERTTGAATTVTASAAATGGGAAVTVSLAAAANVTVTITNLAGVPVAALPARDLAAGMHSLLWDGRSSRGTRVPGGCYLVRVEAVEAAGTACQVVTVLRR